MAVRVPWFFSGAPTGSNWATLPANLVAVGTLVLLGWLYQPGRQDRTACRGLGRTGHGAG